jgi:hypothetical protein
MLSAFDHLHGTGPHSTFGHMESTDRNYLVCPTVFLLIGSPTAHGLFANWTSKQYMDFVQLNLFISLFEIDMR